MHNLAAFATSYRSFIINLRILEAHTQKRAFSSIRLPTESAHSKEIPQGNQLLLCLLYILNLIVAFVVVVLYCFCCLVEF